MRNRKLLLSVVVLAMLAAVPVLAQTIIQDECRQQCQRDYQACKSEAVLDEDFAYCAQAKTSCVAGCGGTSNQAPEVAAWTQEKVLLCKDGLTTANQ